MKEKQPLIIYLYDGETKKIYATREIVDLLAKWYKQQGKEVLKETEEVLKAWGRIE